jgi:3-oxoacyl-[acyl-carrier protein] reductase
LCDMINLKGRHILITGASRGLGAVCARTFSAMGAELVLTARSADLLEEVTRSCQIGPPPSIVAANLTEVSAIATLVAESLERLGHIDAVLHVAGGGLGLRDPLLSGTDLMSLFMLNIVAAAEINRLLVPHMRERTGGNLVHVGSIAGGEAVASVGYNTAKAALAAYVRSLGNELAPHGIVVTGIQPGGFLAPGNSWQRLTEKKPDVVSQFVNQRLPRGRLGQAEELVPILALLCCDAASMMGGCMVPIDAGEGKTYVSG